MQLSSQRDPAYEWMPLGESDLTVHGYGCFVVSIATLFQRPVKELLAVPAAFTTDGFLYPATLAKHCGGTYDGSFDMAEGWVIGVTNHYKDQGYPTHFLCVNPQTNQQIDPLKYPAKIEPLSYAIQKYRVFSGTKLAAAIAAPQIFSDVPADHPNAAAIQLGKDEGIFRGYPDGTFHPERSVSRGEMAEIVARLLRR